MWHKIGVLTILFMLFIFIEGVFFFTNMITSFEERSQKKIERLLELKKNATLAMAITGARFYRNSIDENELKYLSIDLKQNTKFKNIWFKIVDLNGIIVRSSIPVRQRDMYRNLPWQRRYFSDYVIDCKGIHIASFAPIAPKVLEGYFGVISQFNSIQKELEKDGIDSLTFVDRSNGKRAYGVVQEIDGYKVVNLAPNERFLHLLRQLQMDKTLSMEYILINGIVVAAYPLETLKGERIGWIVYGKALDKIIIDLFDQEAFFYFFFFGLLFFIYLYFLYRIILSEQKRVANYYRSILESLNEVVFISDGKQIVYANKKFYDYFSHQTQDICDLCVEEKGFLTKKGWEEFLRRGEERLAKIHIGNREYIFLMRSQEVKRGEYSVVMIDITRQYYQEEALKQKALKDPLTGLFNRYILLESFARLRQENLLEKSNIVIALIDIDHFKKINDTYGHDVGDEVLKELARLLKTHFRSEDLIFRIGGEEFLILFKTKNIDKILYLLEKLRQDVEKHDFSGISVTISIGVARWCGEKFEELFKKVDEALYRSKRGGRNRITYKGECNDKR